MVVVPVQALELELALALTLVLAEESVLGEEVAVVVEEGKREGAQRIPV